MTAVDVARAAGVSKSAVSRTFSVDRSNLVAEERRRAILSAAAELGYRPNRMASSLARGGQSGLVGVLIGNFANPMYLQILGTVAHELKGRELHGIVFNTEDPDDVNDAVRLVLGYQVDGLLVTSTALTLSVVTDCRSFGVPIVSMFGAETGSGVTGVETENEVGGRLVGEHLLARGASRIAFLGGDVPTSEPRLAGLRQALEVGGCELAAVVEADHYAYETGAEAMRSLLRDRDIDAVFCADDNLALGAMDVARHEFGRDIPGDLMIAGFDDIPAAAWRSYDLTTVRQPVEQIVSSAVALLAGQINKELVAPATSDVIPGELVVRGSTTRG
ncbi:MAG: LacI family DNA-binding transcriptional regulator [Acidimicrobiaceae bacterium]|nr:LacI family DNA-binding transcriptional regulator [Acidimicrobiaceae bacterium]